MDLSSPEGFSVNNGIAKEDCSFHYASVDLVVEQIRHLQLGPGTLMATAYRNICHGMAVQCVCGQGPSIWTTQY